MCHEEGLGKARVPFRLPWDPVRNLVLQTCAEFVLSLPVHELHPPGALAVEGREPLELCFGSLVSMEGGWLLSCACLAVSGSLAVLLL